VAKEAAQAVPQSRVTQVSNEEINDILWNYPEDLKQEAMTIMRLAECLKYIEEKQ